VLADHPGIITPVITEERFAPKMKGVFRAVSRFGGVGCEQLGKVVDGVLTFEPKEIENADEPVSARWPRDFGGGK
jgi:hypothetical protein